MSPLRTVYDIGFLKGCYYDHIPEVPEYDYSSMQGTGIDYGKHIGSLYKKQEAHPIEVRFYEFHYYDSRRIWVLGSVYFLGKPVMIFQNAGREGDDHRKRFITDVEAYREMIIYLRSLHFPDEVLEAPLTIVEDDEVEVVDPNETVKNLTYFYSQDLDDEFKEYD